MATTVRMPEVLANATEAAIQAWSVAVGDTVAVGQPFAEIETDKAVVEYAAETAGTVLQLLVEEGASVEVGSPIAVVGDPGESIDDDAPATPAASSPRWAADRDCACHGSRVRCSRGGCSSGVRPPTGRRWRRRRLVPPAEPHAPPTAG